MVRLAKKIESETIHHSVISDPNIGGDFNEIDVDLHYNDTSSKDDFIP
jgi:hypothetical protein